jgi:hypothetical protein
MTDPKKSQMELLREKLLQERRKFGKLFIGTDGEELLAVLRRFWYDGDLLGETPEKTAFNLGAREVVRYIIELHDAAKPPTGG